MRCFKLHTWQLRVGYKVKLGSPKLATAIWNVYLQLADSELAKSDRTAAGHYTCWCASKCGAGGGVEAGWSGDKRLLFPAEWGTSVKLGSVKRAPPSGCTDPGL